MQLKIVFFRMRCHVLWWLVTNTSEERASCITFLPWRWGQHISV